MPATPRHAATVILVRGGAQTLEVLLVQRTSSARFMPGAWVFPGGAIDPADGHPADDAAQRTAALRELEEEAGIDCLDPAALVRFSRWITPSHLPIRFDTHFFLAPAPPDVAVIVDGTETVAHRWLAPRAALDLHERDELLLVLPTLTQLGQFAAFPTAAALFAHAEGREVLPVEPRMGVGEKARILLPSDPGYDAA